MDRITIKDKDNSVMVSPFTLEDAERVEIGVANAKLGNFFVHVSTEAARSLIDTLDLDRPLAAFVGQT